ncbi:hypothetical protein C2S51_012327 [Perilla frutescens var. frutescens]|nr:hypothetical protein C2S51_012327 [Perilla frutescens var. frutescens]
MLKHLGKWPSNSKTVLYFPHPTTFSNSHSLKTPPSYNCPSPNYDPLKIRIKRVYNETPCRARRRVIYDDEEEEDGDDYGYNEELAMLESYTQLAKDEILFVQAMADEEQVEVLIFKGFSSCLNYRTSSNPSRSVLPAKAVIMSIDRARGPFDPSNIQYIERGLTFDDFKSRLPSQN